MARPKSKHEVRGGECLSSISEEHGFFVDTLWEHPDNAALRELRPNPYVLEPGDMVQIPALTPATVQRPTDARHVFRRRGIPERFRLQLLDEGEPEAGVVYRFEVAGLVTEGETDDEGWVEEWIPTRARRAQLTMDPEGENQRELILHLGQLRPPDTEAGVRTRLTNLGYLFDEQAPPTDVVLALCLFQDDEGLEINGTYDDPTCEALAEANGS